METRSAGVVVITGAASGLGRACALERAAAGFAVVAVDVDGAGLAALEGDAPDGSVLAVTGDVSDEDVVREAVAAAGRVGPVVGAVTSAAALGPAVFGQDRDVVSMSLDVWDTTMAVNLRGTMLVCKHAVPAMVDAGGGSIVTMASGSALAGTTARTAYAASKGGVIVLTKYVAASYGAFGVRCNAIAPGLVMTPSAEANLTAEQRGELVEQHLVPRLGAADDIVATAAFLLSEASSFITGQVISVDGGLLAHQPVFRPLEAVDRP